MDLERLPPGTRVLIDANVFVYHFTGLSPACRGLLERCERAELRGVTTVTVLAEVTHRLMMIEAVRAGLVSSGNVAAKLRGNPDAVRALHEASAQVARVPLMGIEVFALDLRLFLAAADLRRRYGLLTNDSLIAATALDAGVADVASADRDFDGVGGLTVWSPADLPSR